jgi:RNA polymerase sigma factor FliA
VTKVTAQDVRDYMPLVHGLVSSFMAKLPPNVLRDDLVAAGTFGLVDSLRKNPDNRGPAFEWYARVRIRGAILDELRAQDWLTRRARARVSAEATTGMHTVVSFDDLPIAMSHLADEGARTPLELTIEGFERHALDGAVESLPERERTIVRMHYFNGEQFKTIAQALGVSEPRISQLHTRAVAMLKEAMGERGHEAA